jgi:hypothetical protein
MAERYRSKPGSNIWHSASECSRWPLMEYWSHGSLPRGGALCTECEARQPLVGVTSPAVAVVAQAGS